MIVFSDCGNKGLHYYYWWKNVFDQQFKKKKEHIRKVATSQRGYYTTGCFLYYSYFKDYYKIIAIDISKQQTLDVDPKGIQQINFNGDLERYGNENTIMFFVTEEANKTVLYFFTRSFTSKIILLFALI